uniref:Uncharacterized protein n=1 Tax=Amazona collaria TaxID=241587 RepID=A0A8B9IVP8_9PSIT
CSELAPRSDQIAGGSKAREEVRHKYRSLLGKLTTNSKRRIDALTALAKESKQFTKDIVFLTEAQITQVFISSFPAAFQYFGYYF